MITQNMQNMVSNLTIDDFTTILRVVGLRRKYSKSIIKHVDAMKENLSSSIEQYNLLEPEYGEFMTYDKNKHRFTDIHDSEIFGTTEVSLLHESGEILTESGQIPSTVNGPNEKTRINSNLSGARYSFGGKIWLATQQPIGKDESPNPTTDDFLMECFLYGNNGDCHLVVNLNNLQHARNYLEMDSTFFVLTSVKKIQLESTFVVEYFNISKRISGEYRTMIIIHYTGWPDFGVPSSSEDFCKMFTMIQAFLPFVHLIMVHCRAGVGRTGTLIAMAKCYEILLKLKYPNLVKIIKELRHCRSHMVQNTAQLAFIVSCLHHLVNDGN